MYTVDVSKWLDASTCDVFISKLDVDDVISWLSRLVFHQASSVWVFPTFNVSFAWTLNGKTKTAKTYTMYEWKLNNKRNEVLCPRGRMAKAAASK